MKSTIKWHEIGARPRNIDRYSEQILLGKFEDGCLTSLFTNSNLKAFSINDDRQLPTFYTHWAYLENIDSE